MKIKSSFPILYSAWILISIGLFLFLLLNVTTFLFSLISTLIVSGILYVLFVNKYCGLSLEEGYIKIRYLCPLSGKIEINLLDIDYVEFRLSYLYLMEDDGTANAYFFWPRPDRMIVYFKKDGEKRVIYFNSPVFSTTKIYRYLKKTFPKGK